MSKEAMKLALEALQLIKEADSHYATPKQVCDARALYEPTIKALEEALTKQEQDVDWKDMYEKEKRRSAMWIAKYEKDIGPLEYAVPAKQEQQVVSLQCANCQVTIETLNDKVMSLLAKQEQGEPVMVNMSPPATQRDRWMYEQGRLAERDPRTHEDIAWELAEKVRCDLDRQSCPGFYMNLAMESIVKHYTTPQQRKPLTMFDTEKLAKQCRVEWTTDVHRLCELAADLGIKE
jgi:hypothetical protein